MADTTPFWLIGICIMVVMLVLLGLEILKQTKDPENTHYDFNKLFGFGKDQQ